MSETKVEETKFKQSLIDNATEYQKSAGLISFDEANKLWASACDGPGVTDTEFATLAHILETFKFTYKGREYLDKLVTKQSSGSSMYKQINNVKYDRSALDLADHLSKDGKLDLGDAKKLWSDVEDGPGVTETEKRTIVYIRDNYTLTDGAEEYLAAQLGESKEEESMDTTEKAEENPQEETKEAAAEEPEQKSPKKSPKKATADDEATPSRPTRERKQVEIFAPATAEKDDKPFVVPAGEGTALGEIENVERRLGMTKAVEPQIKKLHALLYPGQKGNKNVVKAHLRQFKGFDPADTKHPEEAKAKLQKSQLDQIKVLMELLDVQCSGSKEDKIDAIIEFLKKPEASGREFAKKTAGGSTKRKASTKKKSSKKKKAKTSEKTPRKLSAFMHFGMATRPKIKEENPDASFGELGKLLGVAWKEASDKVKAKFQKIADEAAPVEKKASKKKSTKKKPAAKKAKKQESSSEDESEEEEASDSDAPLGKKAGMSVEMKDKIKEIIDGADLEKLTRTQIKADLAKSFDDVEDHKDEIKEFVVSYVNSKK